ncbi:Ig-like domain-containing protein [Lihuaxuella thermophila]|uniref:Ig-like domain (Group 2) n=1 Tax=Lihuaxuella thermophila TaxID=1173111 RepID=A0A1H8CG79_9BACL|nr:Ig-like domain-containing protein [Lihuaxuella thermophila]SEM94093.1 Ig-like domain (group 2) [Lihuaxuella thermophila]
MKIPLKGLAFFAAVMLALVAVLPVPTATANEPPAIASSENKAGVQAEDSQQTGHKHRSEYEFSFNMPDRVGVGEYVSVPVTLQTEETGKEGYENVHIRVEKTLGPGDVLFRATDHDQKIHTYINRGDWGKPGFDLPPDYRETTEWTFKFSKVGTYLITFKLVSQKGELLAKKRAVVHAQPAFADLGVQVSSLTIMTAAFGRDASGNDVIYTVVVGNPGKLVVMDAESEEILKVLDLPGATGAWAITVASDGAAYAGTYPNGHLYRYQLGADQVEDLGQPAPNTTVIYGLNPGKDGKVYGGTYWSGRAFEYDPKKGFTDFGQMAEGEEYVRSLAYDPEAHVIYAGIGAHAHLIKYNIATGEKENILPSEYANYISVYDLDLEGGKLFIKLEPNYRTLVMDIKTGEIEAELTVHSRGVSPLSPDGKVVYYTNGGILHAYNLETKMSEKVKVGGNDVDFKANAIGWDYVRLDDPDFPGDTLFGFVGNYEGKAFKYNPLSNSLKAFTIPLPKQPTDIFHVGSGPDGNIYSSGYISGGVGVYSPVTAKKVQYTGLGQVEGMTSVGQKMYFGVYPRARIYEYDPGKPWQRNSNPKQLFDLYGQEQDRPVAMAGSAEKGKLFIGSVPDYGRLGGALSVYDFATGKLDIHRHIVQNQSVVSLAYKNGKVYAGTSIYGGIGQDPVEQEAKLFVWDVDRGEKTFETVPVPGETVIRALTVGPDGNIWGLAEGTLFIFDPETNTVIYKEDKFPQIQVSFESAAADVEAASTRGGAHLELGKDGYLYGTADGKFFKINPYTKHVTVLREQESFRLARDWMGNFYFKNGPAISYGNTLWRYTIEDRTVSVTGVVLDRTALHLSAGETTSLTATVEPVFATNKDVAWTSSNIGVATVDPNGRVIAVGPGTAVITVTTDDGSKKATCVVQVQ